MEDKRRAGRRESDLISNKEAAERSADELDRIAIIAMEQGSIANMQDYIRRVHAVNTQVTALADEIILALEKEDYETAKIKADRIEKAMRELIGIETRIFEGEK